MNTFRTSNINDSIYVMETSRLITISILFTFNLTIHSPRYIKWNAHRDVEVDYDLMSYE